MEEVHLRKVRSFVRRPGRITNAQRKALVSLLPRYGIPFQARKVGLTEAFGREAPRVLDIGFGDGEALFSLAVNHPEADYLGVEVHEPGIGHLLLLLERSGLANVRIINRDVTDVLAHMLSDRSLDAANLFFPDPWPKKRHHKRRLVQPPFVSQIARVLKPGALLHIATDWEDYAEHVEQVLSASALFLPRSRDALPKSALSERPPTKFERRGRRLGHRVRDLYYLRSP